MSFPSLASSIGLIGLVLKLAEFYLNHGARLSARLRRGCRFLAMDRPVLLIMV